LIPRLKKRRFFERAGLGLPPDRLKKSIWIHALSVGEVVSAIPLVRSLNRKYPRKDIVFTVTTPQGMEIACKELEGAVKVLLPMPLDFWWSVQRVVNYINPSFFILIETDLWPGLISYLKRRGIKTVLINGRISPRTFRSYKRFRFFIRIMFNSLELCLMQSDLDKKRLLQIGIGPDRVKVAGNIKFDHDWSPMVKNDYEHWLNILALKHEDDIWVAGSTHQGEEEVILDVFKRLRLSFPLLRLIIAPRRIERAGDTCRLSLNKGLKTVLKTELTKYREPYDVLILDTIGELRKIYGVGKISFVGGSLVPIGGHNLLEPATFGLPVLFGPHTDNFVLMSQLLIETGGGRRVKDEEDLFETIKELLSDPERSKRMGGKAREFVAMNRGALGRVMDQIERLGISTK
jgi:3-deoxy-D-manno-octulosonic-acid transferase